MASGERELHKRRRGPALVATAAGLFAAIPAVIAYNYFLTKIRKTAYRVEAFSIEFFNTLDELASDVKEAEVVRWCLSPATAVF